MAYPTFLDKSPSANASTTPFCPPSSRTSIQESRFSVYPVRSLGNRRIAQEHNAAKSWLARRPKAAKNRDSVDWLETTAMPQDLGQRRLTGGFWCGVTSGLLPSITQWQNTTHHAGIGPRLAR
jgi:hypothetical protein